jgi:hypothetical protein
MHRSVTVLNAEGLTPVANYYSPIQDRLWAAEEIISLSVSPEFLAAATALAGRRLEDEGGMQNLPPDEWLRLRANFHGGSSIEDRITRWLLQWPNEQKNSF